MAPAKTGKESNNNTAVISTDHKNSLIKQASIPGHRIFLTVEIKFKAPKIEEAPAK